MKLSSYAGTRSDTSGCRLSSPAWHWRPFLSAAALNISQPRSPCVFSTPGNVLSQCVHLPHVSSTELWRLRDRLACLPTSSSPSPRPAIPPSTWGPADRLSSPSWSPPTPALPCALQGSLCQCGPARSQLSCSDNPFPTALLALYRSLSLSGV